MQVNRPFPEKEHRGLVRLSAQLWPWPLGQFPFGYFYNDFLKGVMWLGLLLILSMLSLSVYSANAYDVMQDSIPGGDLTHPVNTSTSINENKKEPVS